MARLQLMVDRIRWTLLHSRDDRGSGLVEYALLVALIALVVFAAVTFFGQVTSSKLSFNASCFDAQCGP